MSSIFAKVASVMLISFFLIILCTASEAAYYLISSDGYVAVCETESGTVYRTSVRLSSLPQSDVHRLEKGIACADKPALAAALENFDS